MTGDPEGAERTVRIDTPTIRLAQLMKLAGLVDSGGDARPLLASGAVRVNGSVETRRGRQLGDGDVVAVAGARVTVTSAATS